MNGSPSARKVLAEIRKKKTSKAEAPRHFGVFRRRCFFCRKNNSAPPSPQIPQCEVVKGGPPPGGAFQSKPTNGTDTSMTFRRDLLSQYTHATTTFHKSYPQVGLGVLLGLEYNVYQVGKSGKNVDK